ncbi:SIR2 family protein [Acinetobacter pittii]|uniref:SIR2 family protein n=1 Tax=Acinetobacter pittii TaxID=48296 RepID=UPI003B4288A0
MTLTKKIAYTAITDFFSNQKPFVLFGTGTSCSLDLCFGMPALESHLRTSFSNGLSESHEEQWQQVVNALDASTHDFESAMDFIKDEDLTFKIIELTANFIANHDAKYAHQLMCGETEWPAGKLIKRLVDTLPQADKRLHVATPNYDLLAEYSFIGNGIPYITGFHGGYFRHFDWNQAKRAVQVIERSRGRNRQNFNIIENNHIRLHKPHGSLNTFEFNNRLVECDGWILNKPPTINRAMITPGTAKYQRLHKDRTQLAEYDNAVLEHTSFLFLGFGFNDSQLVNNNFLLKLKTDKCPALVITRDINSRVEKWLEDCPNMWIICKQEDNNKTRIYNSSYKDWLYINDKELWRFDDFTNEFLGK